MGESWNMNGRYKVFSIDGKTWVDIDFTQDMILICSNTKKITLIPHEPIDTYVRRLNEKINKMEKDLKTLMKEYECGHE